MPNTFAKLQHSFSTRSSSRPRTSSGFPRDGPASHTLSMSSVSSAHPSGKPSKTNKGARRLTSRDTEGLRSEPGHSSDFSIPFPSPARSQRHPHSPLKSSTTTDSDGHAQNSSVWQRFSLTVHHGQRRPMTLSPIMSSHLTSSPNSGHESILSPLYDDYDGDDATNRFESRYAITTDALPRRNSHSEHRRDASHTHDPGFHRTHSDTVIISRLTSRCSAGSLGEGSDSSSHESLVASSYRDPPMPSSGCALIDAASLEGLATLVNALEWDRAARVAAQRSVDNWPNLGGLGPPPRRRTSDSSLDTTYSALQGKSIDSEAPIAQPIVQLPASPPLKIKTITTPPTTPVTPHNPTVTNTPNSPRSYDFSLMGEEQRSSDTATPTPLLSGNRLSWTQPSSLWQVHEAPLRAAASPVDAREHFLSGEMRARIDGLRARRQQERQRLASDPSQRFPTHVVAWHDTRDAHSGADSCRKHSPSASPKHTIKLLRKSSKSEDESQSKTLRSERSKSPLPLAARSLSTAIISYNGIVAEACTAMYAAAQLRFLPDGSPPYAAQARNAMLPEPLLKSKSGASLVAPDDRPKLLAALLSHLVHTFLWAELCDPFCFSLSKEKEEAAKALLVEVISSSSCIEDVAIWQRILHKSFVNSLPSHSRSQHLSRTLSTLQDHISVLFYWSGVTRRISEADSLVAKGYGRLRSAADRLAQCIDTCRQSDQLYHVKLWELDANGCTSPRLPAPYETQAFRSLGLLTITSKGVRILIEPDTVELQQLLTQDLDV